MVTGRKGKSVLVLTRSLAAIPILLMTGKRKSVVVRVAIQAIHQRSQ